MVKDSENQGSHPLLNLAPMSTGWVVEDSEGLIQHARTVILPDPLANRAMAELVVDETPSKPTRRMHTKAPLHPQPRLALERLGLRTQVTVGGGSASGPTLRAMHAEKVVEEELWRFKVGI